MEWPTITKAPRLDGVSPNLQDYSRVRREFSWAAVRAELDGLPGGHLNIAHEAISRQAKGSLARHVAIRWVSKAGEVRDYSFADLEGLTSRFANVLRERGVGKGGRVFALAGRIPELYVAALGTLKNGSVFCPLFSAFGPEPIQQRMSIGEAAVLVTTDTLYRRKVAGIRDSLPNLEHVLIAGLPAEAQPPEGTDNLATLMGAASTDFETELTLPDDPALLHFTSGTTGKPKGALHVHEAVVAHFATGRYALDFHPSDVFWCTADPGWVTGTSYGIVAPLVHGITSIVDEEEFDPERWYALLEEQHVSVWYTAPTAIRMLMRIGPELPRSHRFPDLRFIASVGEPLNPEAVVWGQETLGLPIHDNWWQTETGGIMIANYAALDIRPGSMGRPLPGIEAAVAQHENGVLTLLGPGVEGELVIKRGWPSMFREYLGAEERYRRSFAGEWYLTGDLVRQDADGYFWFVGRADDVIKSSGHLIGPFEVESALMEHPSVAEAAVIGKPDPVAGEIVKAFVSLKPGSEAGDALRRDLMGFARTRLGAAIAPKEIDFLDGLPRTRSGKIMRRLLKARELGLPEGDTSTLEAS